MAGPLPPSAAFLVGLLALLALAVLVGAPVLFWAGVFSPVIVAAFWSDKASGLTLADRTWRAVLLALWMPLGVMGLLAPFRAVAVWVQQGLSGLEPMDRLAQAPVLFLDFHLLNALIGLCGLVFGLYGGGRALRQLFKIKSQLEHLPRSKAAAAALGLAEFSGRVVPVEGPDAFQDSESAVLGPDIPRPESGAVLWRAEALSGGSEYVERRGRFWLEDDSGRILVDPGKAKFKEAPGGFWDDSLQGLVLGRGLRRYPGSLGRLLTVYSLKAGQEAYVLGTVQPDPMQRGRVVVAPDPAPLEQGLFTRLFPTSHMAKAGGDPTGFNSPFLVSDARESLTRLALQKSARGTLAASLAWMLFSGAFMTTELRHLGPGAWVPARWIPVPPPPPPPLPPRPAAMFRVTQTHYLGIWLLARDRAGSSNGHWGPDSVAKLQNHIRELGPRAVFVLAADGAEQRLAEALAPLGVTVTVVSMDEFEAGGGQMGNDWSLATYAERQADRSSR